jgi:hypothetical protein
VVWSNACLLTDTELARGPTEWEQLEDSFAPWEITDSHMPEDCNLPDEESSEADQ